MAASEASLAQLNAHHASLDYSSMSATYLQQYWSIIDGHVRLVQLAELSVGKSVLDVACGPGIIGYLASERVGGAGEVYFTDNSMEMLKQAKKAMESKYSSVDKSYFQRCDFRDPASRAQLKKSFGKPQGFDVVFAKLFISHFRPDSKGAMVEALLDMCAPNGVAVFDVCPPSPSLHINGRESDEIAVGWRRMRLEQPSLQSLSTRLALPIDSFDSLVTAVEVTLGQRAVQELATAAGGSIVRMQESVDRNSSRDHGQSLWTEAIRRTDYPREPAVVKADIGRREYIDKKIAEQARLQPRLGQIWGFRVAFGMDTVVRKVRW